MQVIKRNGKKESVKFDKITARIEKLCYGLDRRFVSAVDVAKKVIEGLYDGVSTTELDNLAAETSASLTVKHPDYALLASRIAVSNLHKNTTKSFSKTMQSLYECRDERTGKYLPLIADDVWKIIHDNAELLDSTIIYDRDYGFDYFGFKTLEKSYLLKLENKIVERPQHMYMRVAIVIHKDDIEIRLKGQHFKNIASQGQRKSLLFAMKLAEYDILKTSKGFAQIILLDDVFEKLDALRMHQLLERVCSPVKGQLFITDTHGDRIRDHLHKLEVDYEVSGL